MKNKNDKKDIKYWYTLNQIYLSVCFVLNIEYKSTGGKSSDWNLLWCNFVFF